MEYIEKNKQLFDKKDILELALKELYKETYLMKTFIELNLKAKTKIIKKYKKYTKYCAKYLDVDEKVESFCEINHIKEILHKISTVSIDIEKLFTLNFFDKYSFKTNKILKDYITTVYFTELQSFYFGFFVGLILIMAMLCIIIGSHFDINMDDDSNFKRIFPMFR